MGSQIWKHMPEITEYLQQYLWREPRGDTSTLWYDGMNTGPTLVPYTFTNMMCTLVIL